MWKFIIFGDHFAWDRFFLCMKTHVEAYFESFNFAQILIKHRFDPEIGKCFVRAGMLSGIIGSILRRKATVKRKNVLIKENLVIIFKITVYLHVPKFMYQKGISDRSHVLQLNFEKPSAIIKTIYSKSNLRGIKIILWKDNEVLWISHTNIFILVWIQFSAKHWQFF